MPQRHPRLLPHELVAGADDLIAVVVLGVARDRSGKALLCSEGVLDPEFQPAERLGLELEVQLVFALGKRLHRQLEGQESAQREVQRFVRTDPAQREGITGVDADLDPVGMNGLAIERDPLDAFQRGRAQAVLDGEAHPRARIPQAGPVVQTSSVALRE